MSLKFLLDTNMVIGLLKRRQPALQEMARLQLDISSIAVSQITRLELLSYPDITPDEEATINRFLADSLVLLVDAPTEQATIVVRRRTRLKLPDAIVAATAKVNGLQLVTLDDRLSNTFASL